MNHFIIKTLGTQNGDELFSEVISENYDAGIKATFSAMFDALGAWKMLHKAPRAELKGIFSRTTAI